LSGRDNLLLIAPRNSYRIYPFLKACEGLGIEALVVSDGKHSLVSALAQGLHIDLDEPDAAVDRIVQATGGRGFRAVIGTDDATVPLAYRVARALGLPGNPPAAAVYAHRKDRARMRLREAGVPVPDHEVMALADAVRGRITGLDLPVVLKPVALSGSRGVIRADSPQAFVEAARRIQRICADRPDPAVRDTLLVEAYLPGTEVALEGLLDRGQLHVLAIFDKPDPLVGPYFEETYYVMPTRLPHPIQRQVQDTVAAACAAYGLRDGPVHAELRLNNDGVWVIEVAARTIGGQCARLLRIGAGYGVEELVVAQAVGRPLALRQEEDAAGVLMIPIPRAGVLRRVEGVLAAHKVPFIQDVEISVREGYELVPLPEGSSYLGFIFARAPTPGLVKRALREAYAHLTVVTAPIWRIEGGAMSPPRAQDVSALT
jgi:biotin carboxylase